MNGMKIVVGLLCGLMSTTGYADDGQSIRVERLFDENPEFSEKLFRSGGDSVATVVSGDSFSGDMHLHVTPAFRGCEFFYDEAFVWQYGIDHNPVPGEFRYVLFAWRKSGGSTVQLGFRDDRSNLVLTYFAGEHIEHPTRANRRYIRVAEHPPETWDYVIRDMAADVGEEQPNFMINGIYLIPGDGEAAEFDAIYLGASRDDLEQLVKQISEGNSP